MERIMLLSGKKLFEKEIEPEYLYSEIGSDDVRVAFDNIDFHNANICPIINTKYSYEMEPEIACCNDNGEWEYLLYGNCAFVTWDDNGNLASLTDKQIEIINKVMSDRRFVSKGPEVFSIRAVTK